MTAGCDASKETIKPGNGKTTACASGAILHGYAFSPDGDIVRVNYILNSGHTATITRGGEVLQTTMDEMELQAVLNYYSQLTL